MDYQKVIDGLEKTISVYGFDFKLVHAEFTPKVSYYRPHVTANYTHKYPGGKFKINRTFVYIEGEDEFRESGCSFSDGTDYYGDAFRLSDFENNFHEMIRYKEDKIDGSKYYLENFATKPNVVTVDNPNVVTIMGIDVFNKGEEVPLGANPKNRKIEYKNKRENARTATIFLAREFDENGKEITCDFTFFYHGRYHGKHFEGHKGKDIFEIFDSIKDLNNRVRSGMKTLQKSIDYLAIDREVLLKNYAKHLMKSRGFTTKHMHGLKLEQVEGVLDVLQGVIINTNVFKNDRDDRLKFKLTEIYHDCKEYKTIYEASIGEKTIRGESPTEFNSEIEKNIEWFKEKLSLDHPFVESLLRNGFIKKK